MYLYLHIPFCKSKCSYCAFASVAGQKELYARYCEALKIELKGLPAIPLETVFFGGGTPTCLPAALLYDLMAFLKSHFGFAADAEISIEANPGTVDSETFSRLYDAGVNRLSLGVQAFDDLSLHSLGRIHTAAQAEKAVFDARSAGFDNISLDLMYGLAGQSTAAWEKTLQRALSLKPEHLSLYQLGVEEGTQLAEQVEQGRIILPGDDLIWAMDEITLRCTETAGFIQYETSNYSLPGKRCKHNINYWHNADFYGAGAGAVSYLAGRRELREKDPAEYIRKVFACENLIIESEELSLDAAFRETVIMGLRMNDGVVLEKLKKRFGWSVQQMYGEALEKLIDDGFVECSRTHLRLSAKGRPFANRIMAELV